jgi:hypothetical protein
MRGWSAAVAVLWTVFAAAPALAQKVDVVTLRNGDHLTCEVKKLDKGRLTINTDALDKVTVFWQDVAAVTSPREFEVTVASGDKFYGTLGASPSGDLAITDVLGPQIARLDDVTLIVPLGTSIWSRMDGSMDAGLSLAQANRETHYTLNASGLYRSRRYRISGTLASQLTTREDADRTFRNTLTLNGSRLFQDNRWFLTMLGQIQQNEELDLELRTVGGGGVGNAFSQTNHRMVAGYTGLVYTREHFSNEPADNLAEVAVGAQIDFFTAAKHESSLTNSINSYYALGRARARLELQSAWRHEFMNDFYFSVNGIESFDSNPPEGQKKNDYTVSLTIGWSF